MKLTDGVLSVSPTDLANFLACRHKTSLDFKVARHELSRPTWVDPLADVLRARGEEHERQYIDRLRTDGRTIVDLSHARESELSASDKVALTIAAMQEGADVIVQAPIGDTTWFGYADVLFRIPVPSGLGAWSYEAHDAKLSRETRGGTILQLCVYTDVVGAIQGATPEHFVVVTPAGTERFRFEEFAAFYRLVRAQFRAFTGQLITDATTRVPYPDPVSHCDVCRWSDRCVRRRRADDHLSFVAGLGRVQQAELEGQRIEKLEALAAVPLPLPFVPTRGAKATYERLREQARLQVEARETHLPVFELLPPERPAPNAPLANLGLARLPEPSPGDLFLDLEGDPFAREGGREYLFGVGRVDSDGTFQYAARWARTDEEERAAFEAVVDEIVAALAVDPHLHIYHYAPYEPAAFKRLMGRYASREAEIDALLRGGRFVDLFACVRQAVRAGVEHYSIKNMEPFYDFARDVALPVAGGQRRVVELALETGDFSGVTSEVYAAVLGYNRDDCRSALELRRWLETLRAAVIHSGTAVLRPDAKAGEASESVSDRQMRVAALRTRLMDGMPADAETRTPDQRARYLLAYLIDWQYREDKVAWWEYFRLLAVPEDELEDEPAAVTGLEFIERVGETLNKRTGKPTGSVVVRYRYPPQEMEIREGAGLRLKDESTFGSVVAVDREARTLDVKKGKAMVDVHPLSAFRYDRIPQDTPARSVGRVGEAVAAAGFAGATSFRAAVDLLLRHPARIGASDLRVVQARPGEKMTDFAVRIVGDLDRTVLAIQGPPGSGKTFTGAQMICRLVRDGRRVGVTATSHKVIRNLLDAVAKAAHELNQVVRLGHKTSEFTEFPPSAVVEFDENDDAVAAVRVGHVDVLGGTAWLWSSPDSGNAVDVLFVDEAGQMSLANAVAVSPAAQSVVLLGDPQQLEQPQKGSHPDGVDISALQHMLGPHKTMPTECGIFLPVTWRLSPPICTFTSEVFYEGKLTSKPALEHQRLAGTGRFDGAGLWLVEVEHEGNRNASIEEVQAVTGLLRELTAPGSAWIDEVGDSHPITVADVLVVAPYNAQVSRLREALPGVSIGTVDKFQGQQAPVVIYSMATSRPEDAPRGMEFLYSLNRLNVAVSRAQCACIVVACPRLFEPDCQTPRQMQLANALCRYRELARH